jgi:glycosyltransferase involved in cell wall biosynthesis
MRVVVCTVVHHPEDARILHRQIRALLEAGHQVTYLAPAGACGSLLASRASGTTPAPRASGTTPAPRASGTTIDWPGLAVADVPRAIGRRRAAALRGARRRLARHLPGSDLLLIHDPELLLVLPFLRRRPPAVWDVHEDTAAALSTKAWLPRAARPAAAAAVRAAELMAERRLHLILAEHGYASRFRRAHPVVQNTTYVPAAVAEPGTESKVVYIGHLSPDRGAAELAEAGALLRPHGITVEIIGPADRAARAVLERAQAAGAVRWHGFVPNDRAVRMADGALAGLSLLHDEPNFRHSLPTKVAEYMAHGVPVVTSPLPVAADLVERHGCGLVVPFGDAQAVAGAVLRLRADPALRAELGRRGHQAARQVLGWPAEARAFVAQLEQWAGAARPVAEKKEIKPDVITPGAAAAEKQQISLFTN